MISLSSEITDRKGRRAVRGWLFFDADCAFCTRLARRFRSLLESHGFGLAALQDERAQALLAVPAEQLLKEVRLVTRDGEQFGGADALIQLAREIWWAWPVYLAARLPGMRRGLRSLYRWVAARRNCYSEACLAARRDIWIDFRGGSRQ